jgi:hypothetical protein
MKMTMEIGKTIKPATKNYKFSFKVSIEDSKAPTKCKDSNINVYPFKQFSRALGSATLIDAPSTDTVGICLIEKENGPEKKTIKASLVKLVGHDIKLG